MMNDINDLLTKGRVQSFYVWVDFERETEFAFCYTTKDTHVLEYLPSSRKPLNYREIIAYCQNLIEQLDFTKVLVFVRREGTFMNDKGSFVIITPIEISEGRKDDLLETYHTCRSKDEALKYINSYL